METLLSRLLRRQQRHFRSRRGAGGTEAQWTGRRCSSPHVTHFGSKVTARLQKFSTISISDGRASNLPAFSLRVTNAYGLLKSETASTGWSALPCLTQMHAARRPWPLRSWPEIADDTKDVDSSGGYRNAGRSSGRRRSAHQQNILRCASDPQADRHRRPARRSVTSSRTRETCMRMLRSKLIGIKERASRQDLRHQGYAAQDRMGQPDPQLRLHALYAGQDTRTGFETSNINAVMDGDLDGLSTPTSPALPPHMGHKILIFRIFCGFCRKKFLQYAIVCGMILFAM